MHKHFQYTCIALFAILFAACGTATTDKENEQPLKKDTYSYRPDNKIPEVNKTGQHNESTGNDTIIEYADFFIVIADTGTNYFALDKKMYFLSKQLNLPVDTMGRYFNQKKNLIALPDNDEDEIYAGDYFPRRFPSENLSLEYLDYYKKPAGENTIALISGIYETERSADSALAILKKTDQNGFKLKANLYIGCMH